MRRPSRQPLPRLVFSSMQAALGESSLVRDRPSQAACIVGVHAGTRFDYNMSRFTSVSYCLCGEARHGVSLPLGASAIYLGRPQCPSRRALLRPAGTQSYLDASLLCIPLPSLTTMIFLLVNWADRVMVVIQRSSQLSAPSRPPFGMRVLYGNVVRTCCCLRRRIHLELEACATHR